MFKDSGLCPVSRVLGRGVLCDCGHLSSFLGEMFWFSRYVPREVKGRVPVLRSPAESLCPALKGFPMILNLTMKEGQASSPPPAFPGLFLLFLG